MRDETHRPDPPRIACFISPHGFGHAARAAATMEALGTRLGRCHFEIFTTVPSWFFADSLSVPFSWHPVATDIGLVQQNAFLEDIERTVASLDAFLPFAAALVADLAEQVRRRMCRLILCDIAPLGIAVGRKSGIPSVLIENFTWDRIYAGYPAVAERMGRHISYLRRCFNAADHHIQTEPVCFREAADLTIGPISRRFRTAGPDIRRRLGIPDTMKIVLITTGGIPERHGFLDQLKKFADVTFIVPGGSRSPESHQNVVLLPHRSVFFHPDLVNASDAVVGKVGYSTIAEVYAAGVPFGHVARYPYPESPGLVDFVSRQMRGIALSEADFSSGRWLTILPKLLDLPRQRRMESNAAEQIAAYICSILDNRNVTRRSDPENREPLWKSR
ncbi:MAG: hypothetical protein U5R30_15775 [Deltaproteobacteria bacterium]|nr:hypothetical protein [Deltaproteobacteria bacterium]